MADRHERRRLGHPVALHDREAQPPPEGLSLFAQRRAARHERPELPAESTMNVTEDQPSLQKMFALSRLKPPQKLLQFAPRRVIAVDLFAQSFELARHGGDYRDALAFDRIDDFRRVERARKEDLAEEQSRHEHSHKLAEDVAQREQAQKPDRVKWALELQVFVDLGFEWSDVGQQVAVRQANTFRLRRRARSKYDLGQVVCADLFIPIRRRRMTPDDVDQLIEAQRRLSIFEMARLLLAEQKQFGLHLSPRAIGEIGRALFVQRDCDRAAQQATEEGRDPFGTVLAPKNNAVAFAYAARFKLARELKGRPREPCVRPARHT